MFDPSAATVRQLRSADLGALLASDIRTMLEGAFRESEEGELRDADWQHALGGEHFLLEMDGALVAHAAVVQRQLEIGGRPVRTGYVEAVAVAPARQGRGLGSLLMRRVDAWIAERFELGALGTGSHHFYERLGWETWRGPTGVRMPGGIERTLEEDGYILVLRTPASPPLRLSDPITCDWRAGDAW